MIILICFRYQDRRPDGHSLPRGASGDPRAHPPQGQGPPGYPGGPGGPRGDPRGDPRGYQRDSTSSGGSGPRTTGSPGQPQPPGGFPPRVSELHRCPCRLTVECELLIELACLAINVISIRSISPSPYLDNAAIFWLYYFILMSE